MGKRKNEHEKSIEHQQWQWESNTDKKKKINNWFLDLHHPHGLPPPPPPPVHSSSAFLVIKFPNWASIPQDLRLEKHRTINQPWPRFYTKRSWRCRIISGSTFLFVLTSTGRLLEDEVGVLHCYQLVRGMWWHHMNGRHFVFWSRDRESVKKKFCYC